MNDGILKEAFQTWEELSMDDKEYAAYEVRMKQVLDEQSVKRDMELLKLRLKKGKKKGWKRV